MNGLIEIVIRETNKFAITLLTSFPIGQRIFNFLAEPYVAGHSLEEGLEEVDHYWACFNRYSTMNILGEAALTVEDANQYMESYKKMIDALHEYDLTDIVSVSVKPSAICAVTPDGKSTPLETPLTKQLEKIVYYAWKNKVQVTLDMEDHNWTDASIQAAKWLWGLGYDNLGIALQSKLNRTKEDIKLIFSSKYKVPPDKIRVRACIGIYDEDKEIATKSKKEAKERLIERVKELFDSGAYVEIATHDHKVIRRIIKETIEPEKIPTNRFEFQFLKGVQNAYAIEQELMSKRYKVRYYMPVEINPGDGIPYMQRRLTANPGMVAAGAKNFLQSVVKRPDYAYKQ